MAEDTGKKTKISLRLSHCRAKEKLIRFLKMSYAKVLNFTQVFNGLQKGVLVRKEDISDELLKRIQDGAKKTSRLNNNLKIWFDLF